MTDQARMDGKVDAEAIEKAIIAAEREIKARLIKLEEETGGKISSVEVDTRNYAGLAVMIWFKEGTP